ncbi:2 TM domain-containing transmembrane protein [Acrasis kona]|uniref:2 TM domain-containing transmembrane protein n=1 Tax=Acrasis kona TaxID=1008807 RepID=A0AAW2ZQC0_9EUKA
MTENTYQPQVSGQQVYYPQPQPQQQPIQYVYYQPQFVHQPQFAQQAQAQQPLQQPQFVQPQFAQYPHFAQQFQPVQQLQQQNVVIPQAQIHPQQFIQPNEALEVPIEMNQEGMQVNDYQAKLDERNSYICFILGFFIAWSWLFSFFYYRNSTSSQARKFATYSRNAFVVSLLWSFFLLFLYMVFMH